MHRVTIEHSQRGRGRAWRLALVGLGLLVSPVTALAQRVVTEPQQVITVSLGESALLVEVSAMQRFSIGDPTVADAAAVSPNELLITGKKLGTTSLLLWDARGDVRMYTIQVTADAPALERYLRSLFPDDTVAVAASGNTVTLYGRVRSAVVARQIVEIAEGTGATVIDRLQSPPSRQVALKVRFAELSKSAAKEMASQLATLNPHKLDSDGDWFGETISDGFLNFLLSNDNASFLAAIKVLQSNGQFKTLAEPTLITLPGEEASFLAGGEFPFPIVQGGTNNTVTIQFKEFGVRLTFTPTVTESGNIRLKVAPEVSSLDFANGLSFQGFQIPTLRARRAETSVELREGQHLAIAGLIDNTLTDNVTKIPFLGDIPILGAFFRSHDAQQNRSELLVVVTPQLVEASDTAPELPTGEPGTWDWYRSLRDGRMRQ